MPEGPQPQPVAYEKLCCKDPGRACTATVQGAEDPGWLTQLWLLSSIYGKNSVVLKSEMIQKLPSSPGTQRPRRQSTLVFDG